MVMGWPMGAEDCPKDRTGADWVAAAGCLVNVNKLGVEAGAVVAGVLCLLVSVVNVGIGAPNEIVFIGSPFSATGVVVFCSFGVSALFSTGLLKLNPTLVSLTLLKSVWISGFFSSDDLKGSTGLGAANVKLAVFAGSACVVFGIPKVKD